MKPPKKSIIYSDKRLYVCMASYPLAKGHTIIAWKKWVKDLHTLSCEDYDYLMNMVDVARDALLRAFKAEKVYLIYMDEAQHVHWHLVPRYNVEGFNLLNHQPKKISDFSLAKKIKLNFNLIIKKHHEFDNLPKGYWRCKMVNPK